MENTGDVFIDTVNRLFPSNIAAHIKSLYQGIVVFQYLGLLNKGDFPQLDLKLSELCLSDEYTSSELHFIIRDILIRFTIDIFRQNGLDLVNDDEVTNIKTTSDIISALSGFITDELAEPIDTENLESDDTLYENICSIISMYSTMSIIDARELVNDVSVEFCNNLNLCLKKNVSTDDTDDEYRFELVHKVASKDPNLVGTRIVNDLVSGNLQTLALDFKEDQKIILKYLNRARSAKESVNELLCYLLILDIEKHDIIKFLEENLNYEHIIFVKNSNDKKFEYIKLLENRIKQ